MEHYERKYQLLHMIQGGRCFVSGRPLPGSPGAIVGWANKVDLHHAGVKNADWSRKAYPLLIHSILNLALVYNCIHTTKPIPPRWPDPKCSELELMLQMHREWADLVNARVEVYDMAELKMLWWQTWAECWPERRTA